MFCENCGKEIQNEDRFCFYCGAENPAFSKDTSQPPISSTILENSNLKNTQKKKDKIKVWIIVILCVVLLIMSGVCIYLFLASQTEHKKSDDFYTDVSIEEGETATKKEEGEDENSGVEEEPGINDKSEKSVSKTDDTFQINGVDVADYGNVLDSRDYAAYSSEYENFSFSYPTNLYESVEKEDSSVNTPYGTNLRTVTFIGDDGSELKYSISQRKDATSLIDFDQSIFSMECGGLVGVETIKHSTDDGTGKIIISGFTDSSKTLVVYDVIRIYDNYVMQMKVVTPSYAAEEDKQEKGYYTECLYRLCGFSGSEKAPRTYKEFQAGI